MIIPDVVVGVLTSAWMQALTGGTFGSVYLYANDFVPDSDTVLGDFDGATLFEIPGYTPRNFRWTLGPVRGQDGNWRNVQTTGGIYFANGPPPIPITAYGWFMVDAATGLILLASGRFDSPFTFASAGDGFSFFSMFSTGAQENGLAMTLPDIQPQ